MINKDETNIRMDPDSPLNRVRSSKAYALIMNTDSAGGWTVNMSAAQTDLNVVELDWLYILLKTNINKSCADVGSPKYCSICYWERDNLPDIATNLSAVN